MIMSDFENWASGFSGCDGGDIGTPESRSTWVCGIEWGGGHDLDALKQSISNQVVSPPLGYDDVLQSTDCIFNRQTMKLITAMQGLKVEEYEKMSLQQRPFVKGTSGFFKMNLFPISFKDTAHQRWQKSFNEVTGFANKEEYLAWCRRVRFEQMRFWVSTYKPKVIICFGKTLITDYALAFAGQGSKFTSEKILNRDLSWTRTVDDVLIAICPFPVNRYGLNSNALLQGFGDRIRTLMAVNFQDSAQPNNL